MPELSRRRAPGAGRSLALVGVVLVFVLAAACGRQKGAGDDGDAGGSGDDRDAGDTVPAGPNCVAHGESGEIDPCLWRSVAIRGGGFVSGLTFSPVAPDLIYARTDIGGAYRWDAPAGRWIALLDFINREYVNLTGVESIVADPVEPDVVYIAVGTYLAAGNGAILRSADRGRTFEAHAIGVPMGGNQLGRSMGERLAVDPNQTRKLYFASRTRGLRQSTDAGATWTAEPAFPMEATGGQDIGLAFVLFDGRAGAPGSETRTIYVGVGGTAPGSNLYRSTDAGASFALVSGGPTNLMPHHAAIDTDGIIYLAYNNGPGPDDITAGAVWKYTSTTGAWTDVSPDRAAHGFGGIAVDVAHPGTVMATTLDWWAPDEIFRSTNGGATWMSLGARAVRDVAGARYLYFGGATPSATGRMGDIEIDPFNSARASYITGQGVWRSDDVTRADSGSATHWTFRNEGLEETVTLDMVSPPDGAPLLSALGDVGGFRHDDLDTPVGAGMFTNPLSRDTTSIDFAENEPLFVVRVGRATAGTTDGRGAYSTDGGTTWMPFPSEPEGSLGEGAVAVSADGGAIVWMTRGKPAATSHDRGASWTWTAGLPANARPVSDRVNPLRFYAFLNGQVFVSNDAGDTFSMTVGDLPAGRGRLRTPFGIEGDVWLVMNAGLFRSTDAGATFVQLERVQESYALGFGQAGPGRPFPTVYQSARIDEQIGIFRSDDAGVTWTMVNDPDHQFGQINAIAGDPRRHGRIYLGTAGRGIIYGDVK